MGLFTLLKWEYGNYRFRHFEMLEMLEMTDFQKCLLFTLIGTFIFNFFVSPLEYEYSKSLSWENHKSFWSYPWFNFVLVSFKNELENESVILDEFSDKIQIQHVLFTKEQTKDNLFHLIGYLPII